MCINLKKLVKTNERYKDFTLLECPVRFKDMQADNDIDVVQLHDIYPCGDNEIVGFCGICSWKDNILTSLDGDSYTDEMLVYGYSWFTNEEEGITKGLDILVEDW